MINDIRILQGAQALHELKKRRLLPRREFLVLAENLKGEEGLAIAETIKKVWQTFETTPTSMRDWNSGMLEYWSVVSRREMKAE